ncbi:MAG: acetoacetate--CoA ligase [Gammaproteobacteria bacterium]|nr:acetoacetate--CoA ligase [Gammaproteobacteria bacterium]
MTEPLWTPSADRIASSRVSAFMREVAARQDIELPDYAALHRFSIEHPEAFWRAVVAFCGVIFDETADSPTLRHAGRMPGARWFPGMTLNFAENLLRHNDRRIALQFVSEAGHEEALSYAELRAEVGRVAAGLRAAGITPGDRVAAFMPNRPETVILMLAAASIGAMFSSCSPDFGVNGVLDRFGQIEPRVLLCCDGYIYAGKRIDTRARTAEILAGLPSVERVLVVGYLEPRPALDGLAHAEHWQDFGAPGAAPSFERLPFEHPLYIMYSSGTTGAPKCIVHGAGGTLLQHLKELVLHVDLDRDDAIFYFTTCGWMMWNWLVSSLAVGARVLLFDGSPFAPAPGVLWDMAERHGVSVFGTSAKYLAALEKAGERPARSHNLERLRTLLSTGSPLLPASYDFVYRDIHPDVQLASISGGTDIVSCFALGTPLLPVYRGELQAPGLGMAVAIYDDEGQPLPASHPGELVCTQAFPSMPLGFWNDPEGRRYHDAYFARFENTWCHGDWAELTPRGGLVIHGRSDATLNPGGVRIGTAEIYRQVEKLPEIAESIVVGQDWEGDVRVVLFVRLQPGAALDDALRDRIRRQIREHATPRHVPAHILAVADIPRTISGKIVELAVRNVIHGRPVKNRDVLANPEALEYFRDRPELAD